MTLARRGYIELGTTEEGAPLYLSPKLLDTHMMIQAPTGHGKTFLSRALFRELAPKPVAIFCDDPKGDYVLELEEDCAALGLEDRVSIFDTSDPARIPILNPLKKNGIPVEDQAEWLLDAIRQSHRQDNFDETPQRPRWMFNALLPVIEGEGTFDDVLGMLNYTDVAIRRIFIERTSNPLVRKEWLAYQELSASRRREETNSAFAWLRKFCINTTTRRVFTPSPHAFDFGHFLRTGGIHLQRIMRRRPLSEEQVNFIRSVSLSMLLANAFHIPLGERPPLYILLDESEHLLSREPEHGGVIETILNEGRSLGIHLILIFHTFAQVAKTNPALLATVLTNCRTKIIGGKLTQPDLEILTGEMFVKDWHPYIVRDEITALEVEPVETTRVQRSISRAISRGRGLSLPENVTDGTSESLAQGSNQSVTLGVQHSESVAETTGTSRGRATAVGRSVTDVSSWAETDASGDQWAEGESNAESWANTSAMSIGQNVGMGEGTVTTPEGDALTMTSHEMSGTSAAFISGTSAGGSHVRSASSGGSRMHASTIGGAHGVADSVSASESVSETESHTTGETTGTSLAWQRGTSKVATTGASRAISRGVTPSWSEEASESHSVTVVPFHELRKRWRVASREFLSLQDFLTTKLIQLKSQPKQHWAVQTPQGTVVFFRAVFIKPLIGGKERLAILRDTVLRKPWYQRDETSQESTLRAAPLQGDDHTRLLPAVGDTGDEVDEPTNDDFAQPVPKALL